MIFIIQVFENYILRMQCLNLSSEIFSTLRVLRMDCNVLGTSMTLCQELYLFKCTLLFVNLRVVNVLYFSNFLKYFSLCFNVSGFGFSTLSTFVLKEAFSLVRKESGFVRCSNCNPSFSFFFSFWKFPKLFIDVSSTSSISSISM